MAGVKKQYTVDSLMDEVDRRSIQAGHCRLWVRSLNRQGYAQMRVWVDGKLVILVHRALMMLHKGRWLAPTEVVMHTCDRPNCVNYNHLRLGTQKDNSRDCWAKGRGVRGAGRAKMFSAKDVRTIRKLRKGGASLRTIAVMYSTTETSIHNVANGKHAYKETA